MAKDTSKRAEAVADQLRYATKQMRQARDFLNVQVRAGGFKIDQADMDAATVVTLTPIVTAALDRLAKRLAPARKRKAK